MVFACFTSFIAHNQICCIYQAMLSPVRSLPSRPVLENGLEPFHVESTRTLSTDHSTLDLYPPTLQSSVFNFRYSYGDMYFIAVCYYISLLIYDEINPTTLSLFITNDSLFLIASRLLHQSLPSINIKTSMCKP